MLLQKLKVSVGEEKKQLGSSKAIKIQDENEMTTMCY